MESRYLIDALSLTSKDLTEQDWIHLLGLEDVVWDVTEENKRGGFAARMDYDGMHLHYGGTQGYLTWLELTGQGCRDFETFGNGDYDAVFSYYLRHLDTMHLTRLDVAFDDADTELLDMEQLCQLTMSQQYVSKFKVAECDYCVPQKDNGHTIYLGSKHSDFFVRIYDKAKERGFTDGRHWVRVELQMRRDYAAAFIQSGKPLKEGLLGVLAEYIRFVYDPGNDSNKWRWPSMEFWDKFLDGAERVSLVDKPGVDYNLSRLQSYVIDQAGSAASTFIKVAGFACFFELLKEHEERVALNPKYKTILQNEVVKRG